MSDMFSADSALRHCFFSRSHAHLKWLWHKKLSDVNFKSISNIYGDELVRGMPKMKFQKDKICSTCVKGKQTKSLFKQDYVSLSLILSIFFTWICSVLFQSSQYLENIYSCNCWSVFKIYLSVVSSEKEPCSWGNHIFC